jgi:hypothetical protein
MYNLTTTNFSKIDIIVEHVKTTLTVVAFLASVIGCIYLSLEVIELKAINAEIMTTCQSSLAESRQQLEMEKSKSLFEKVFN